MKLSLTIAMKNQLLSYLMNVYDRGEYWGNLQQFWTRHAKIEEWIRAQETMKKRND